MKQPLSFALEITENVLTQWELGDHNDHVVTWIDYVLTETWDSTSLQVLMAMVCKVITNPTQH